MINRDADFSPPLLANNMFLFHIAPESLFTSSVRDLSIQIYWKFYNQKKGKFSDKKSDIFHIPAQYCRYLEPPWRGGSNEYLQSMF